MKPDQDGEDGIEDTMQALCSNCGQVCEVVEDTFDYPGTHCTFGRSGTHHTGHYVSTCCLEELEG